MSLATGTLVLTSAKAAAPPPTLIGFAGQQYLLVVQNRGPLRVLVGSREDLQSSPGTGIVVAPLESYTHTGPDALYAMLDAALQTVTPNSIAVTLAFQQYLTNPGGPAPIAGPAFPWPSPADWGAPT